MNITKSISGTEAVSIIGERFKEYRFTARLTQQEAADMASVSKTAMYRFDNGRLTNVSFRTVIDLLRAISMMDRIDGMMPAIPVSPYLIMASCKKATKVYHKTETDTEQHLP